MTASLLMSVEEMEDVWREHGLDPEQIHRNWDKFMDDVRARPVSPRTNVPPQVRAEVFKRDGWTCIACGSAAQPSIDHVLPRSRGGGHTLDNLQTLCRPCNSSKGARTMEEWH